MPLSADSVFLRLPTEVLQSTNISLDRPDQRVTDDTSSANMIGRWAVGSAYHNLEGNRRI